jgi:alpha-ketoglutarate-dependent taurine dioxygenase
MADTEALPLLKRLLAHATQGAHEYRHKWHTGDFVMWDNRNLLHKANGDYDMAETRYLYRLMLPGGAGCINSFNGYCYRLFLKYCTTTKSM